MLDYIAEIKLDLNCMKTVQSISAGQYDKGRKLLITITANGEEFDISNATAVLKGVRFDKTNFALECTIENNKVIAILDDSVLSVRGKTVTKIVLIDSDRNYSTQMFIIDIDNAFDGDVTTSENYSILNHLIQQVYMLENGAVLIGDGSISLSQLNEDVKGEFSRKINDEDSVIETSHLKNASVTTDKILMGAVTNTKIAEGAVAAYHIKDNAVPNRTIVDGAVSAEKLAKNSVTEEKILMESVTNTKLAKDSVSTTKIQNGAITTDKMANGAVGTNQVKDASITTVKINPGAVTNTRIAEGAVDSDKLASSLKPLFGKKMYADGDSIVQAPTNGNKSFVHYIAEKNNMTLTCEAKGGTTLAKRIGKTGDSKSIYERIEELTGNYDYIVLDGGGNDLFAKFKFDKPEDAELTANYIGKVSESYDVNDFDVYTTCGALEAICYKLVTDFTSSKILFVLIHRKNDVTIYDSTNNPIEFHEFTAYQKEIWSRLKEVLKKWGIPYVDLSQETHLSAWNKTIADKYFMYKDNQLQGDGTHPNELGYKQFYVPIIEARIKTL